MCGIAGIIWEGHPEQKNKQIRLMTDAIAHRGPNAEGHYVDNYVALGHRRLSIIDLSPEANQPFWDSTGRYAMVFNGEVYNYAQIRQELSDYPFRTKSDTEVILAAYIRWGEDCLHRFFGMFALAIWDSAKRELFLARDRLGIKPLYFYRDEEKLAFASEIRAFLASGLVRRELDAEGIRTYLNYQTVHAPKTLVKGLMQLKPGESATLSGGGHFTQKMWWQPGNRQPVERGYADYETVKKQVRRLLRDAVERRLVSDVPLGAFLSGGIDSSAIVALMAETSEQPVDTFSVVFEEEQYDESQWSGMIARQYNTRHHAMLLKPADFLEALPEALRAMDSPSGDGINSYVVSKVTKEAGVTVALSGLGGDELFGGYSLFKNFIQLNRLPLFWKIPAGLRRNAAAMLTPFLKVHQKARLTEIAGAPNAGIEHVFPPMRKLLTNLELGINKTNGNYRDSVQEVLASQTGLKSLPLLSQLSVADISTYTQNVLLKDTDQMSMAHALEVRVPFFDHALVEYVLHIPDHWKYPVYPKKLLVESLGTLLPKEVVFRKKKGFELPWKIWLKNELKPFCSERLARLEERNLVSPALIRDYWKRFLSGNNDHLWSRIWVFVVLEDWLERHFDG